MKIVNVRRDNLRRLIQQHDGPTALAKKLGYKNAAFLVTMAGPNPTREVTEKNARAIESKLGLPPWSLDGTTIHAETIHTDLIREVVLRVAEHLETLNITLAPAKLADTVLFIYADAVEKGSLSAEVIRRVVHLAK